jgi:hypothetical protein
MSFCPTHNKVYLPTYYLLIDLMLFFVRQLQFSKSVNDVVQVWEGGGVCPRLDSLRSLTDLLLRKCIRKKKLKRYTVKVQI